MALANTTAANSGGPDYRGAAARALFQKAITDSIKNEAAKDRQRADLLALKFYRGGPDNQWVVWDGHANQYVPRPYDDSDEGLPAWIPRCVTNTFANKIDGITAILNQSKPAMVWQAATDDDEDNAAADLVNKALPALRDEIGYDLLKHRLNQLATLTDKVAVFYFYDNDEKYGLGDLPMVQCAACNELADAAAADETGGKCPTCGQDYQLAIDPTGVPVTQQAPIGRLCAHLFTSFEFAIPSSAVVADENEVEWVLTFARMPLEDALRQWGKDDEAKAAIESAGRDGKLASGTRMYAEQMKRMSAPLISSKGTSATAAAHTQDPLVYRIQHEPTSEFPEGYRGVMVGDVIVDGGPLPVKDGDGRPRKSFVLRTYMQTPGSPFGKPPSDDLVPLQQQNNLLETLLLMIFMNDAAPTTYIPMSVTLEDEPTGRPGEMVRFRSMVPGEVPIKSPGMNPPEAIFKGLDRIDQKFNELSNLNAVLQGARPAGDPTLGEVQILEEQGRNQFSTPLGNLTEFEKRQDRILLWIARESLWSPRFWRIAGENGGWEVEQFTAADLGGKVDVFADAATAWPRSPLAIQMRLDAAAKMGVIIPAQDPELAEKILDLYGLTEFKPSLDVDKKQVARELDRWRAARSPQEIAPPKPFDNLPLHLALKANFLKTEEAELLAQANPQTYMAMLDHVRMLQMAVMQQQAAAQGNQPEPDTRTPAEKGDDSAVRKAQDEGVLQPAGAGPDPMQELTGQGVLQPAGASEMQAAAAAPSIDELVSQRVLQPLVPQQEGAPLP